MPENGSSTTMASRLKSHIPLIGLVVCVVLIIGLIHETIKKPVWRAKSSILMAMDDAASASLGSSILQQKTDPQKMLVAVLGSDTAKDIISKKTGVDRDVLEYEVRPDVTSGAIFISYNDPNGQRAIRVVQAAIDTLTKLETEVGLTTASKEAKNLEAVVKSHEAELHSAEDRLAKFQLDSKTVPDPNTPYYSLSYRKQMEILSIEQAKVTREIEVRKTTVLAQGKYSVDIPTGLPPNVRWRDNLIRLEEELRLAKVSSGPDAPNVKKIEISLTTTRQLVQKEIDNYLRSVNQNLDPFISQLETQRILLQYQLDNLKAYDKMANSDALEYQRKLRDVLAPRKALEEVMVRYEIARVRAEAQKVRWSELDRPHLEPKPMNKNLLKRIFMCVGIGALLGGGLALMVSRPKTS
ncbi:MAG: hypothetical protein ABJA67_08990 [Chthonomonadales bacterium]